jgi:hypothetical protein
MESLQRARNAVNAWINENRYATLNDFYNEIGLPPIESGSHQGWDQGEFMDFSFSAVLTEENKPCMAFNYNYVRPLR